MSVVISGERLGRGRTEYLTAQIRHETGALAVENLPAPSKKQHQITGLGNVSANVLGILNKSFHLLDSPDNTTLLFMKSSSVHDDGNDAELGTGAHTIVVDGLVDFYQPATVEYTLNGVGPVSVGYWKRINWAYVSSAGSAGTAVGTITIYNPDTDAVAMEFGAYGFPSVIANGMQAARFSVGPSQRGILRRFSLGIGGTTWRTLCVLMRTNLRTPTPWRVAFYHAFTASSFSEDLDIELPPDSEVAIAAQSDGTGTTTSTLVVDTWDEPVTPYP